MCICMLIYKRNHNHIVPQLKKFNNEQRRNNWPDLSQHAGYHPLDIKHWQWKQRWNKRRIGFDVWSKFGYFKCCLLKHYHFCPTVQSRNTMSSYGTSLLASTMSLLTDHLINNRAINKYKTYNYLLLMPIGLHSYNFESSRGTVSDSDKILIQPSYAFLSNFSVIESL